VIGLAAHVVSDDAGEGLLAGRGEGQSDETDGDRNVSFHETSDKLYTQFWPTRKRGVGCIVKPASATPAGTRWVL
jgi:hypothetical protein